MMKKTLKNLVLNTFSWFSSGDSVVSLMYHSISSNDWEFSITPETFENQIKYLKEYGYTFLNLEDLEGLISGDKKIKKGVLVTFDDGYKDFVTNAMPILNKYNASALIFIHTSRSSSQLKNDIALMDWQDIKSLSSNFELGSHSHSHSNLKKLSIFETEEEIQNSSRIIGEITSRKPIAFAYPYGLFKQETIEALKENDYKFGFTTDRGVIKRGSDPFRIKRFGVGKSTSFVEFKARLTLASDWYEGIVKSIKLKV